MKKSALAVLVLFALKAQSQDLIIHYDFIHDKFTYEQRGKFVSKPVIRKNYEVKVMVENLNPFVFIARCKWHEEVVENNSSISGIASMFTGLNMGNDLISGILSGMSPDMIDLASERSDRSMFGTFAMAKIDLQNAFRNYNSLFDIEQTLIKSDFTTAKLKKMKFNPYMPADTLKKVAAVLVENALKGTGTDNLHITSTTFINRANYMATHLNEDFNNLLVASDNFLTAYNAYRNVNGNDFSEAGMDRTVKNMVSIARQLYERYNAEDVHNKIEALEAQYNAIIYTPFVYVCNYMANSDRLSLELDFYETSPYTRAADYYLGGGDNVDTLRNVRSKKVNVLVQGDMKITTSIGLGFPTYFSKNQEFSNRDSLISSSAGNNYSPCISTFINFYPFSGRNIHWGGTFGVGIPVQSGGTSNLNFFLGGSAVLGGASKVAINGGLAIGQLPSLIAGQKVGDNLGDKITTPEVKKVFMPGAFFGISFSLGK